MEVLQLFGKVWQKICAKKQAIKPAIKQKPIRFRLAVLLVFIFIYSQSIGQGVPAIRFQETVYPPAGTAAAAGGFGDIPVNLNSGTPSIGIPLGSAKGAKTQVPISLSYHATGVKVDNMPSWVGTNWTLDAGGVITRTVKGLPDETALYGLYVNTTASTPVYVPNENSLDASIVADFNDIKGAYYEDEVDWKPDIFHFNFLGRSGTLGFDKDGNFYSYPENDFKFVKNPLDVSSSSWEIIDASGTRFIFGADTGGNGVENAEYDIDYGTTPMDITTNVPSAWYLTKVISADGLDEITLDYVTSTFSYTRDFGNINEIRVDTNCADEATFNLVKDTDIVTEVTLNGKGVLSKITTALGTVDFVVATTGRKELEQIVFKDNDSNTVRTIVFDYSTSLSQSRLFLTSVQEKNAANDTLPKHEFSYFIPTDPYLNVETAAYHRDYWGYFNDFDSNTNSYGATEESNAWSLKSIKYPSGGRTDFEFEPHDYENDDNPSVTKKAGGIRIKSVKNFLTSSDTVTASEKHYRYNLFGDTKSSGKLNFHPQVSQTFTYDHYYLDEFSVEQHCEIATTIRQNYGFFGQSSGSSVEYTNVTVYNGYADLDDDGVVDDNELGQLGKTENTFRYTANKNNTFLPSGILLKQTSYSRYGTATTDYRKIRESEYFNSHLSGSHKKIQGMNVQREEYQKSSGNATEFSWSNYDQFLTKHYNLDSMTTRTYDSGDDTKYVETTTRYTYTSSNLHALATKEYTDELGDTYKTTYNYVGDHASATGALLVMQDKHMLSSIENVFTYKNGDVISAAKTDYTWVNTSETDTNLKRVYPDVTYKAALDEPVSQATFDAGSYYVTTANFDNYNAEGLLTQVTGLSEVSSSNFYDTSDILLLASVSNAPEDKIFHDSFEYAGGTSGVDAKTGNKYRTTNYTKSGLVSGDYKVTFWARKSGGSDGTVSGSSTTKTVTSSDWEYFEWNLTSVTSVTLNLSGSYLDEVRIHPPGAFMTTFTYDSRYRKTSQTGPNQLTTYFEYDGFDRLLRTRDHEKNILVEYDYEYGN